MAVTPTSNRVTGLFSGMDTDAVVKAMVSGQQRKVDLLNQSIQKSEWKKTAYTDINNALRIFRETFGSVMGETSMMAKGSFNDFAVKMAENSGVSIKATASAKAGQYSVRVDQLATASSMKGSKLTSTTGGLSSADLSKPLNALSALAAGAFESSDGKINFSINGKDFSFSASASLKTVMDTVNKSGAGVTMAYSQITDSVSITSNSLGQFRGLADPGDAPAAPDAYAGLRPAASDYGTTAEYEAALAAYQADYDDYQNTVVAQYKTELSQWNADKAAYEADQKRAISVTDLSGFLAHLGLGAVTNGVDARVYINGETTARTIDSNSLTLDGVTFTFQRPTDGKVDFSVERNVSSSVDKIKKFVEEFNNAVKSLNNSYTEKKNYKYSPLTDEQKSALSDKEIELYEAQAKAGLLYRDDNIGRLMESLRSAVGAAFGGSGKLSSIGITTGKYMVGEPFQLEIDEEKLAAALEEDADRVYSMFSLSAKDDAAGGGFMTRINTAVDGFISRTKSTVIQNLTDNITSYTKRVAEQEKKLTAMSERYYTQYAKMERALSKMQSQQDALSSYFSTGTGK